MMKRAWWDLEAVWPLKNTAKTRSVMQAAIEDLEKSSWKYFKGKSVRANLAVKVPGLDKEEAVRVLESKYGSSTRQLENYRFGPHGIGEAYVNTCETSTSVVKLFFLPDDVISLREFKK